MPSPVRRLLLVLGRVGGFVQALVTRVDAGRGELGVDPAQVVATARCRATDGSRTTPGAGATRGGPGVRALVDGLLEQVAHTRPARGRALARDDAVLHEHEVRRARDVVVDPRTARRHHLDSGTGEPLEGGRRL